MREIEVSIPLIELAKLLARERIQELGLDVPEDITFEVADYEVDSGNMTHAGIYLTVRFSSADEDTIAAADYADS